MSASPYFHTPRRRSTIFGTTELNFCVRYGNRWTLSVIDTNCFLRTNVIISQGFCFVNSFFHIYRPDAYLYHFLTTISNSIR